MRNNIQPDLLTIKEYFSNMVNSVSFAIRMYRHNSLLCKQCFRVAFSAMDAIFSSS